MISMKDSIVDLYENVGGWAVILAVILALAMVFGWFCLEGWIFMLLWNWLAVGLFSAQTLSYWLCVGIVFALQFVGNLLFRRNSSKNN